MRRLAVGCLLAFACTHEVKREALDITQTNADEHATENRRDRIESGPVDVTTTTEEYSDASPAVVPDGSLPAPAALRDLAGSHPAPLPRLTRRTVIVEHRGPVVAVEEAQTVTEVVEQTRVVLEKHSDTETNVGAFPWLWLSLGAGVVVAAGVGWHFRGPLLKLL